MPKKHIHIIGGGVIGLCSAYFLNQEGVKVTIVDRSDLSDGTSHGNAGMIVPSHFVPMASPGVIAQGIKWIFDSKSPFYIKPRLSIELGQWLWKFYRSCNRENVNRAIPILFDLNEQSKALYKAFSEMPEFSFCFEEKGLLMLYKSRRQEEVEMEMAHRAHDIGIEAKIMSPKELAVLEPDIELDVKGGLYFPGDAHLYPNKLILQMIKYLKDKGVEFVTERSVIDFKTAKGKVEGILMDNKEQINVENLLISSGSWTGGLFKKLGIKLPLQDGKGYSITLNRPSIMPKIPTILSEAKVAITPMGGDLRIGGTLEISNFSNVINKKRMQGIIESVPKYYPQINLEMPKNDKIWYGFRPCTPDGMPYVDQSLKFDNVYVASGHGMMGLSLGPATGKMISEIFLKKKATTPNELMRLDRF